MRQIHLQPDFQLWRRHARRLLVDEIPPEQIMWIESGEQGVLPGLALPDVDVEELPVFPALTVPRAFVETSRFASCHRDPQRWSLLYRVLWRLTHGESNLLERLTDNDVRAFQMMEKSVRRDRHKMTAFVRFRRVEDESGECFIAWHRPDHHIVKLTAPFFADRFASMRWTILTPDASASWDGKRVAFGPGVPASSAPRSDELEALWKTYYASIFNPARIKLNAMRKEMPVRHWRILPETQIIPDLLRDAPRRVEAMVMATKAIKSQTVKLGSGRADDCRHAQSAAAFLPTKLELPQLRAASQKCQGCGIYCNATQAVFGDGPSDAEIMFVGEQPGDQEDLAGTPFVGPSGKLLDQIMGEVGISREQVYVTNAVKHFKWEPRGKRRLHSKPSAREVSACRPWIEAEIAVIKPRMIVALGATAAQSLFGNSFRVTQRRGESFESQWAPWCTATVHPSALLRTPADSRDAAIAEFADDLRRVAVEFKRIGKHA